jgi:hypothetical protein
MGVAELNGRETLTWALVKLSDAGYADDQQLWDQLRVDPGTNLGADYDWPNPATITGGTLRFKAGISAQLTRTASSREAPGKWRR